MRDFNFFEPYINVKVRSNRSKYLIILPIAMIVAIMIFYQVHLMNQLSEAKSELDSIEAYINSDEVKASLVSVQEKQEKEATLRRSYDSLMKVEKTIFEQNEVTEMMLQTINAKVPENLFLQELTLAANRLAIRGFATEYEAIAQLAFNLRETPYFENVQIPTITESNEQFQYTINAEWTKEVSDEANQ